MRFGSLIEAFEKIKERRIAVIGDLSLDIYWHADMRLSELSLETPNFPLPIVKERFSLGAAGNIVNNLSVLGVKEIYFITVIGEDWRKNIAYDLLNKLDNVKTQYILTAENRITPAYCKPIKHGISDVVYEDSRLDFWNVEEMDSNTEELLVRTLKQVAEKVDIIVVEEQLKYSIITDKVREVICQLAAEGKTVIVDSRLNPHLYSNCIIKPNEQELRLMASKLGLDIVGEDTEAIAKKVSSKINSDLVVTLGDQGSMWIAKDHIYRKEAIRVEGEIDIVGAGDGFISGLASFYKILPKEDLLYLSNMISSIVIKKIGITGSASREEIIKQFVSNMKETFFYSLEDVVGFDIKAAIFDFDGTISTLRHGWEQVMYDYMFEQLSRYYEDKEVLSEKIWQYIYESTGIQTIYQMEWLVDQVKAKGGTPLDRWEYKDGYNEALLKVVKGRTEKLLKGELEQKDFRIPGSKEFIEKLVDKGIKCYIASGTDDVDIKREMKSVGVDHLLEDSQGAPERKKDCPKASVYNRLIQLGYKPNEIMVIGDGKVEMNLGRENGSLTLGIACDEYNLEGIDVRKLDRLMEAGAHAVVIDFIDTDSIFKWMEGANNEEN